MAFSSFLSKSLNAKDLHQLIIGSVSPRPIALVSSISKDGVDNLAPYSFFNAISSNPPILMFSVSLSQEPRPLKDTLINLKSVGECVINIVDYKIARQMSLCSVAFPYGVSEFKKSGLTSLASDTIRAKRVQESPVQFECTIKDILVYGKDAGAANLVLCDVKKIHVAPRVMIDNKLRIDPWQLNSVGRLGRSYYVNVSGNNIFEMYQPVKPECIGFDSLPSSAVTSPVLTGRELAQLASLSQMPTREELLGFLQKHNISDSEKLVLMHHRARGFLKEDKKHEAMLCVMAPEFE